MRDENLIRILEEDIQGLESLIRIYSRNKDFNKATNCQRELDEIKAKLELEKQKPSKQEMEAFEDGEKNRIN